MMKIPYFSTTSFETKKKRSNTFAPAQNHAPAPSIIDIVKDCRRLPSAREGSNGAEVPAGAGRQRAGCGGYSEGGGGRGWPSVRHLVHLSTTTHPVYSAFSLYPHALCAACTTVPASSNGCDRSTPDVPVLSVTHCVCWRTTACMVRGMHDAGTCVCLSITSTPLAERSATLPTQTEALSSR